jgi:hypothetical protein
METLGGLDELMYSLRPALDVVTGSGGSGMSLDSTTSDRVVF